MDVEKTIGSILQQEAKTEARLDRLAESHENTRAELRETGLLLKRAIRAAVKEARAERGRRAEEISALRQELSAAQRRTEASLAAFIESMRHGGNGHPNA